MILGLILARGGSKRCPRKNIRNLGGMPLIFWTIYAGRKAGLERLVVSSDDKEILGIAKQHGAETIVRPDILATDQMSSYPPIIHALDVLNEPFEWLCLLQPTSPFRCGPDIATTFMVANQAMQRGGIPAAVSVEEGKAVPNGAVYIGRVDWLRDRLAIGCERPFDDPNISQYTMPPERSIDIDTEEDFVRAEKMIERFIA